MIFSSKLQELLIAGYVLYDTIVYNLHRNLMFRDLVSHKTGIPRHDAMWGLDAMPSRDHIVMQ